MRWRPRAQALGSTHHSERLEQTSSACSLSSLLVSQADEMDRFDEGWRNLNSAEKHQAAFDVVEWESEAVESYNEAEDSDTRARCEQALDIARIVSRVPLE